MKESKRKCIHSRKLPSNGEFTFLLGMSSWPLMLVASMLVLTELALRNAVILPVCNVGLPPACLPNCPHGELALFAPVGFALPSSENLYSPNPLSFPHGHSSS